MAEPVKTPGELAFQAWLVGNGHRPDATPFNELDPGAQQLWHDVATAARRPLAKQLFDARHAMARLLVTYRSKLLGDWYERSAEDSGLKLDNIGFIKGPYKGEPEHWDSVQNELKRLAEGKE